MGRERRALIEEARGWELVAERIAVSGLMESGLCAEMRDISVRHQMRARLDDYLGGWGWLEDADDQRPFARYGEDNDADAMTGRITFACLLSAICRDEASLLKPSGIKKRVRQQRVARGAR